MVLFSRRETPVCWLGAGRGDVAPVSWDFRSNGGDIALLSSSSSLSEEGSTNFVCSSLLSDGGVVATSLREFLSDRGDMTSALRKAPCLPV